MKWTRQITESGLPVYRCGKYTIKKDKSGFFADRPYAYWLYVDGIDCPLHSPYGFMLLSDAKKYAADHMSA